MFGIHADRDRRDLLQADGHLRDALQLRLGLDVEAVDAL
jgi:hypothetical protein